MAQWVERYRPARRRRPGRRLAFFVLRAAVIALVVAALVRWLLVGTFAVHSESMQPGFAPGDRVLTEQLSYGARLPFGVGRTPAFGSLKRGDVVVVRVPHYPHGTLRAALDAALRAITFGAASLMRFADGEPLHPYVLKRVLGLPGDTVRLDGSLARVKPRGAPGYLSEYELLTEPTVTPLELPEGWAKGLPFNVEAEPLTLGYDEYYLLSDDRSFAADSRTWGPVSLDLVVGRVVARYWPLRRAGI